MTGTRVRWQSLGGLTGGFLAVGVSGVVLLAAAPRLVGAVDYSTVALAWTIVTVFGLGVAQPAEQSVTRAVAAGRGEAAVGSALRRIGAVAVAAGAVLVLLALTGRSALVGGTAAAASAALGFVAWAVLAPLRGRTAGWMRLRGYVQSQGVEAVARIALVGMAALAPGTARLPWLLAAVSVPLLLAALVMLAQARGVARSPAAEAGAARTRADGPGAEPPWDEAALRDPGPASRDEVPLGDLGAAGGSRELLAFGTVALSNQVVLNAAPIVIGLGGAYGPAAAGAVVSALTYLRAPTLLLGSLITVALSRQSALWSARRWEDLATWARRYWAASTVLAALAVGGMVVLAPWLLPLFYGGALDLPVAWLAAMAVATVIGVLAWALAQSLFAAHRLPATGAVWVAAAVATVLALGWSLTGGTWPVVAGLLAGPCVAVAGQGVVWSWAAAGWRRGS